MSKFLPVLVIAAVAASTTGCVATRKFVRNRTEPISQQVTDLDKRTDANAKNIGQLDDKEQRDTSRLNEKAETADNHAADAAKQAAAAMATGTAAGEKANAAQSAADNARTTAETGLARTGEVQKYAENLDNFQMASSKTVYFALNKSVLTDDAMKDLDELAQSLSSNAAHYVIEVQGFTDPSGDKDYNYALSEKRANSVVRYLTEKGNIPVYRIHTIGLGKDAPATAATKREANKLSRRVEVKIYRSSADMPKTANESARPAVAQTTPASQ